MVACKNPEFQQKSAMASMLVDYQAGGLTSRPIRRCLCYQKVVWTGQISCGLTGGWLE